MPMVVAPAPAFAYEGCNSTSTASADPAVVDPGGSTTFTATFRDCNGNGLAGIDVTFSAIDDPCAPTFTPAVTKTDANGVATTTVVFAANCSTCVHTLAAKGGGITVTATVRTTNRCLPFTSAEQPTGAARADLPTATWLVMAAGVALLVTGLALRFRPR